MGEKRYIRHKVEAKNPPLIDHTKEFAMPESPTILDTPNRRILVHEHFNSVTFEEDRVAGVLGEGQKLPIVWEITLPELLEEASMSTDWEAVVDGWRGNQKVGQIKLAYTNNYNSFTMTFVAKSDFTSVHVLSLISATWVVVIRTATEYRVVLIDSTTHQVLGGDTERLDVLIFPFREVKGEMEGIRDGLEALKDGPQVVFQESSSAKERCQKNRKAGLVGVVGTAVLAGLSVTGVGLAAVASFAIIGAMGGAAAALVDNNARTCMEEAEGDGGEDVQEEEVEPEDD